MRISATSPTLPIAIALMLTMQASGTAQVEIIQEKLTADMIRLPDAGRQLKTGTGRIRGRVLSAETGGPIRRAQVRISGQDIQSRAALTDIEGRFEFSDLPAGRFTLQATKSGFVSVQYGQTRPFESGRSIELGDKQVLDNADIAMPRGSVISGRILDEFGEPLPDVSVTALRQSWAGGRRRLMPVGGRLAQTNDLGQFRLYGLPPGDYYVSATLRSGIEMMGMEVAISARGAELPGPTGSNPASGYAPTYFPGTTNRAEAQKLTLIVGQEIQGADFALAATRLAKITGIVISSDGKPMQNAMITLTPNSREAAGLLPAHSPARTNNEGAFTLNSVSPGEYTLQTNAGQMVTSSEGGITRTVRMFAGGPGGGDPEFGSVPVSVSGEDVANIVVITSKGAIASGRVTFEEGGRPPSSNAVRISAMPRDMDGPLVPGGPGAALIQPDGTFELKGLAGGRLIRPVGLPQGWTMKGVRLNGTDITDAGVEFKAGEAVSGLEVVLTSRTTNITGSVTTGDGSLIKNYTVVVFSENPEHWRLPLTRWVTGTRPDQEGRFKIQNLPAGSYYGIAVDYIPQGEWGDPDLLERLKVKAKRFTLDDGETLTLDLKLADSY